MATRAALCLLATAWGMAGTPVGAQTQNRTQTQSQTQTGQGPVLRARPSETQPAPARTDAVDYQKGFSTLPEDASGEYELEGSGGFGAGSVVEITIEQDGDRARLTGYVTRMDNGLAVTLFFERTSIQGSRVSFTTKAVHGMAYSFTGSVLRDPERTSAAETGFYRLAGEWTTTRNETGNSAAETSHVSLKSTPRGG
jgi:hypothetical protein